MFKLRGRYHVAACREDGHRRELAYFRNVITNSGIDRLITGGGVTTYCQVGSGTTPENATQSALVSLVASTSTLSVAETTESTNTNPYTMTHSKTFKFALGAITSDITEVGVGWAAAGSLFSRALIKDMLGAPTVIRVFSDEYLEVTYMVDVIPFEDDIPFSLEVNGSPLTGKIRAAKVNNPNKWTLTRPGLRINECLAFTGPIGLQTSSPSGTSVAATTVVQSTYVAGSHVLEYTLRWDETIANWPEGLQSFIMDRDTVNLFCFQIGFDTPITKDNMKSFRFKIQVLIENG